MHVFFIIFLFIPSLLEGLGLWIDRRVFLIYFSIIASFFYIYTFVFPRQIKIPRNVSFFYFLFLLATSVSTFFFSLDKQVSFELLLYYCSAFLLFIFFYNYKKISYQIIYYFPILLGVIFTCYSFLLHYLGQKVPTFLMPTSGKQFVFALYANHNHLGDFIGLLVLILLYYGLRKSWLFLPFSLFFFIIDMVSFSRSAYISLFVIVILILFYIRKKISTSVLPFIFLFLSIVILMTYLISIEQPKYSPFFKLQSYVMTKLNVTPRNVLSGRDVYTSQALSSILKHPLFGIGGGNFITASQINSVNSNMTDSAHNIFIEIATEQGVLAMIFFLIFVLIISKNILRSPSLPGFLFLYLLVNFQVDYTYQVYSLFLFWIILSAFSYSEKKEIDISSSIYGVFCVIPLIIVACITTSTLFMKIGNYKTAMYLYPLNKEAYIKNIGEANNRTAFFINIAEYIAPYNINLIIAKADYYLKRGDKIEALKYYEKVYQINNLCSIYFIKQIYLLKREIESQRNADLFFNRVVYSYQGIFVSNSLKEEFTNLCQVAKIKKCPEIGWNKE